MDVTLPIDMFIEIINKQPILYGRIACLNRLFDRYFAPMKMKYVGLCLRHKKIGYFSWTELPNGAKHGLDTHLFNDTNTPFTTTEWWFGQKHGKELMYYYNGQVQFDVTWVNGIKTGDELQYSWRAGKHELIAKYAYGVNGIKTMKYRYDDGKICEIAGFDGNLCHGPRTTFYPDSRVHKECYYDKGFRTRTWLTYDQNGNIIRRRIYNNNVLLIDTGVS